MTRDQDIERVLDQWLSEGPTLMPDRFFDEVVDRIDRTPPRRLARLQTRLLDMNSTVRFAAAAAIVLAVAGVGAFALTRPPSAAQTPSPSPSLAATPAPSFGALLPTALDATWVGATRTIPQIAGPAPRSVLTLSSTMSFNTGNGPTILFSGVRQVASDTLEFTLSQTTAGCPPGAVGTYTFALSGSDQGGGLMTLHSTGDTCAEREAAISGDWYRSRCKNVGEWCFGDLAAGAYSSVFFNPWVTPDHWVSRLGALTYTVPAGWTSPQDCDGCFQLAKQGGPADTGIYLFDDVVAHGDYGTACQDNPAPGIGRTAAEMSAYLASRPGLVSTTPQPTVLGSLSGYTIDLSVDPSWTATCPFSNGHPLVGTLVSPVSGGTDWNVAGDGHSRYIFLDLPGLRSLVIDIEAQTKADYDALLPDAMSVVDSFHFYR